MPKRLAEYGLRDLLRMQPLVHAYKSWRYQRIDASFLKKGERGGDAAGIAKLIGSKNVLMTVAFEDPDILGPHLRLCRKFVPHDIHIVGDNSRSAEHAARNRAVADANGAQYVWLPDNPWTARGAGSRSHGAAMNWLWRKIIVPGKPHAAGFLDHDLFPTAPDDPFAQLEGHRFFGDQRDAGERWFLWAGYCFFNFAAVEKQNLDFGLDWFAGLDTGGANYEIIYRHQDRNALPRRAILEFPALEGVEKSRAYFERRGNWLHEVGWGNDPTCRAAKRVALMNLIMPCL